MVLYSWRNRLFQTQISILTQVWLNDNSFWISAYLPQGESVNFNKCIRVRTALLKCTAPPADRHAVPLFNKRELALSSRQNAPGVSLKTYWFRCGQWKGGPLKPHQLLVQLSALPSQRAQHTGAQPPLPSPPLSSPAPNRGNQRRITLQGHNLQSQNGIRNLM